MDASTGAQDKTDQNLATLCNDLTALLEGKPVEGEIKSSKNYSEFEEILLVGHVYEQLFNNPAMNKRSWAVISGLYMTNAELFKRVSKQENSSYEQRSQSALQRHFKVLSRRNRRQPGLLKENYLKFVKLKEKYKF